MCVLYPINFIVQHQILLIQINKTRAKTILYPTGGFLLDYTHTINPYGGCQLGLVLCGNYCYAKTIIKGVKGEMRSWGTYVDAKVNASKLYRSDCRKIRNRHEKLKIFISSVTDPYIPAEAELKITSSVLEAMIELPPDSLVIQTHTSNLLRDLGLFMELHPLCKVSVQVSIETDMENKDLDLFNTNVNFRRVYSVKSRMHALSIIKSNELDAFAVVSPLLPLKDPFGFARSINSCSNYVIFDHFLLGDGSKGYRTSSPAYFDEPLPYVLNKNGYGKWNSLDQFNHIVASFKTIMGEERVGVSKEGFGYSQISLK